MTDLVDQMFPPIHHKWTSEFTDFNYWKTPVQDCVLPDLSPLSSPALTARSDTSAFARLRSFGLSGSKQQNAIKVSADNAEEPNGYRSSHLRQMSSLEKLGSSLGLMSRSSILNLESHRRSASPSSSSSFLSDEEEDSDPVKRRRRLRSRSITSMPGTLDETQFMADEDDGEESNLEKGYHHFEGEDEDDEGYDGEEDEQYHLDAEEEAEAAFDDDLLATGEMQKVPFL
jgi:phosphatidate phosphatase LPIN